MSSYTITNKQLNPNRVFILQFSELEKRWDPQFYAKEYKDNLAKIKRNDFKRLGEIVKFSSETWNQKDFFVDTFPYIEISEIDTLSGKIQKITQVEMLEAASRAKMLVRENDIIVSTTRPSRGAIALITKEQDFSIASTGFSVIRNIINSEIDRNYLFTVLRQQIILKQFEQRSSGGSYPAITQEELSNVIIPLANAETQQKVISIFKNSIFQKQQNEAQAEKLLASIDDYLLGELGIQLPKQTYYVQPEDFTNIVSEPTVQYNKHVVLQEKFKLDENNKLVQQGRIFIANFNEVTGSRFDPNYYQEYHKQNYSSIEKSEFKPKVLKDITYAVFQGVGRNIDDNSDFILLKVKNIKQNCEIDYDDTEQIGNFPASKLLKFGDIITPCIGEAVRQIKFAVFNNEEGKYLADNNIGIIRPTEEINHYYLNYCLNSSIGKIQISRLIGGGGVPFLGADNLKRFIIPVPPLSKQQEIADHITDIRQQAQQLKDKTNELLKKASEKIEEILIG